MKLSLADLAYRQASDAILRPQHRTNVTELKLFFGLRDLLTRGVLCSAPNAAPLTRKMQNCNPSHFGRLNKTGIESLKTLKY